MTDRERLLEILNVPIYPHEQVDPLEAVADYLLDNGVTFQKWIPVTERLPDSQGTYLCRYGFGQFVDYMTTGCIDWIAFDKHPHWQHASTGLFVTHWMPLPEPPKEDV